MSQMHSVVTCHYLANQLKHRLVADVRSGDFTRAHHGRIPVGPRVDYVRQEHVSKVCSTPDDTEAVWLVDDGKRGDLSRSQVDHFFAVASRREDKGGGPGGRCVNYWAWPAAGG